VLNVGGLRHSTIKNRHEVEESECDFKCEKSLTIEVSDARVSKGTADCLEEHFYRYALIDLKAAAAG
jgi:hypothetical protein